MLIYFIICVVKVTQNGRLGSCQNRSTIFKAKLTLLIRKKSKHDLAKSEYDFVQKHKNKTYFKGLILFQSMWDAFTINIELVSDVNLEIEETENKGLEVN